MPRLQVVVAVFLALHVVAIGRFPQLWGVDSMGYLGGGARAAFLLACGLLLIVPIRRRIEASARQVLEKAGVVTGSPWLTGIALIVLSAAIGYGLRSAVHLLGDGQLHYKNLNGLLVADVPLLEIPWREHRAPGSAFLVYGLLVALSSSDAGPIVPFVLLSIACGVAFVLVGWRFAAIMMETRRERLLMAGFLLTGGFVQVFAGYVEFYAPVVLATLIFLATGFWELRGGRLPWRSALVLGIATVFHFVLATLWPALVVLAFRGSLPKSRGDALRVAGGGLAALGVAAIAAAAAFRLIGFDPRSQFGPDARPHTLPLFGEPTVVQAYHLLSLSHLIDVVNQLLLTAPAAVLVFACLRWRRVRIDPIGVFFVVAALGPLALTWVLNPEIGAFRDWDVFAFASVPLSALAGWWWLRERRDETEGARGTTTILGAAAIHTLAFLAVNAQEAPAEERFTHLVSTSRLSKHGVSYGWETLGWYHWGRREHVQSLRDFENAIAVIPDNWRYLAQAGELHLMLGKPKMAVERLREARRLHPGTGVFELPLARALFQTRRYREAAEIFRGLTTRERVEPIVWVSLGLCRVRLGELVPAREAFEQAAASSPNSPDVWFHLGNACRDLGDELRAKQAWARFLGLEPSGERADRVRAQIVPPQGG